jgi:hypothetical protein
LDYNLVMKVRILAHRARVHLVHSTMHSGTAISRPQRAHTFSFSFANFAVIPSR